MLGALNLTVIWFMVVGGRVGSMPTPRYHGIHILSCPLYLYDSIPGSWQEGYNYMHGIRYIYIYNLYICKKEREAALCANIDIYFIDDVQTYALLKWNMQKSRHMDNSVKRSDVTRWKHSYIRTLPHTSLYYPAQWKQRRSRSLSFTE